ncbi:MAG: hypothetical protein AAFX06_13100, partial [Planctomycetota bacterium]
MNEHDERRSLRLERLESLALLAADGFGEFTRDNDFETSRDERPSETRQHDDGERANPSRQTRDRKDLHANRQAKESRQERVSFAKKDRSGLAQKLSGRRTQLHTPTESQSTRSTSTLAAPILFATSFAEGESADNGTTQSDSQGTVARPIATLQGVASESVSRSSSPTRTGSTPAIVAEASSSAEAPPSESTGLVSNILDSSRASMAEEEVVLDEPPQSASAAVN